MVLKEPTFEKLNQEFKSPEEIYHEYHGEITLAATFAQSLRRTGDFTDLFRNIENRSIDLENAVSSVANVENLKLRMFIETIIKLTFNYQDEESLIFIRNLSERERHAYLDALFPLDN